ncbi:hypothetical protein X760_32615 [Mesorhizobium sp. LSHC422A00]|nr:hypothetical protein X762_31395 [Mesorhizobium sp. LSHC426A00]ESX45214.1 hypothetical protein X761_32685 [Mesorhizobium sp. LSHC424B00]ESX48700.1 hypothetical protein X760_32615 [Mesorhizobium sp. LSHC422A00]ESX63956.1 hypothetical protein X758_32585 [Mesorhizobium sp. LSHC416B00]
MPISWSAIAAVIASMMLFGHLVADIAHQHQRAGAKRELRAAGAV